VFSCFVHAKALVERCGEMIEILWDLFHTPDLSNAKQIKDILLEMRNNLNASIIDSGHHFAVTHASSHLVRSRYLEEALEGITQLRFLDRLVRTNAIDDIAGAMKKLHAAIITGRACTVSLTADDPSQVSQGIERLIASFPAVGENGEATAFGFSPRHTNTGIEISSSVNFVAKAWNLGSPAADSMGRFLLLSRNLSTGYLWDNVRVRGGAYGGMAIVSFGHPVFACASYRDPNLSSTLSHFEKGIAEVAAGLDEAAVDQSIIGTIGRIDTPRSPHEKGFNETVAILCGRSPQFRQQVREAVMNATVENVGAAARELTDNHHTSVTVLGNASSFDKAEKEQVFLAREALFSED
jgi:presequence protease